MSSTSPKVRRASTADLSPLTPIVAALDMFPPEMLGEMIANPEGLFLVAERPNSAEVLGFLYAIPEPLTEGTWNMLALGVSPSHQKNGIGRALVEAIGACLALRNARLLIVDTSSTEAFAPARVFYKRLGYDQVAVIPNYWAAGDDKVIFSCAVA